MSAEPGTIIYDGDLYVERPGAHIHDAVLRRLCRMPDGRVGRIVFVGPRNGRSEETAGRRKATVEHLGRRYRYQAGVLVVYVPLAEAADDRHRRSRAASHAAEGQP